MTVIRLGREPAYVVNDQSLFAKSFVILRRLAKAAPSPSDFVSCLATASASLMVISIGGSGP